MAMRLSDMLDSRIPRLVASCLAKTARSYDGPADARGVPLRIRHKRLTLSQAPRLEVRAVDERPGRFVISFLGPKGKDPLVSFEAGSFGGSNGVVLLSDARVSPG